MNQAGTPPPRTTQRPFLSLSEGNALRILEALLDPEQRRYPNVVARVERPSPALLALAKDRLSKTCARYLLANGGWREGSFLRDGQRVTGRLWDAPLNDGFSLRFTALSVQFWLGAARGFAQLTGSQGTGRYRRKMLSEILPAEAPPGDTGDWIVFALAAQSLPKFQLSQDPAEVLGKRLRASSPLLALLELWTDVNEADTLARLRLLVAPSGARIVECLDERLSIAWGTQLRRAYELPQTAALVSAQVSVSVGVLAVYLRALEEAKRLDLAGPLLRTISYATTRLFADPRAIWERLLRLPGIATLRQRDELVRPFVRLSELGLRLARLRSELAASGYGEPRYPEAQRYLRLFDEQLAPSLGAVEALNQAFSDTLG